MAGAEEDSTIVEHVKWVAGLCIVRMGENVSLNGV